jgi:hypothetical protein
MEKLKKFILISLLLISSVNLFCQESEKISPSVSLQFIRNTDDSCMLKATLTYSKNRMANPVPGAAITLYAGNGRSLKEIKTDTKGTAVLALGKQDMVYDNSGMWPFSASFAGNDSIEAGSANISIRDAALTMTFDEVDSVKKVNLHAVKYDNGKMVPAAGEMLTVYVPRMFSLLPLGDATFDEEGNASIDFPPDLPGDKDGNITIIAKFEDHPEFGNIEKTAVMKWGVPPVPSAHLSHRALWTKTAPRWMIYTLTILLTGVWGHYMFALISLVRIKRDANKHKPVDEGNSAKKELFLK